MARVVAVAALVLAACRTAPESRAPALSRTEVTVREYEACVSAGSCSAPKTDWDTCNWTAQADRAAHPVNCVDWSQAAAYCRWTGSRLPAEGEWTSAIEGLQDDTSGICASREGTGTCVAGSMAGDVSPAGIRDLLANVKEWTDTKEMLPDNVESRVIRGGGWKIDPMAAGLDGGTKNRETLRPTEYAADLGFRCMAK